MEAVPDHSHSRPLRSAPGLSCLGLFAAAAFFTLAAPGAAHADFRVCNGTQNLVGVAIGYRFGAEEPAPWVLGGESGGGFGSLAQRFIGFYSDAIRREICDAEGGCLKEKYRNLIGDNVGETVKLIAPVILEALGSKESSLSALPRVAAMLGLWLARSGLEQWCAQSKQPTAGASPAAAPSS